MIIDTTFYFVYNNKSLLDTFFREQSQDTMEELFNRATVGEYDVICRIDSYCESNCTDVDELDEMFYNDSVEQFAKTFELELEEEEEEEEE